MKIFAFLKKDLCRKGIAALRRVNTRRLRYHGTHRRLTGWSAVFLVAICLACGDYYRPVAIPIPVNSPNPAALHFMYAVAGVGASNVGSLSQIDVTGDALTAVVNSGQSPVHAALVPGGSSLYVANSGDDTVSVTSGGQPTTINLVELCPQANPCPLVPVFVASTESGRMYVADKGTGTVSVINTASNAVVATVAVNPAFAASPLPSPNPAAQPVALTEMPNGRKIYSVNQGDTSVTSINAVDGSIAARITTFSAPPIWAVADSDSAFIYVLDQSGTISVIDTLSDTVVSTASAGAGANFIFFDSVSDRLYVTNPTASTVNIFDVSGNTLVAHKPIPITASAASACSAAAVSAGAPVPPAFPTSITVLGDQSRAYVASYQLYTANGATSVCTQADVIDNGTGLLTKTIPLFEAADNSSQTGCSAARFRVFIAASGGSTDTPFKVFVSQCDAGSIADIYTAAATFGPNPHPADTVMAALPAPVSSISSGQISISDVAVAKFTTTYTYSQITATNLHAGSVVVITGLGEVAVQGVNYSVNGVFSVSSVSGNTFTVSSPNNLGSNTGSESGQNGNGTALSVGNPVFLVPGP